MFNFRHPKPVVDGRAVAVQIVQQKESARPQAHVLVVPSTAAPPLVAPPDKAAVPPSRDEEKPAAS